MKSINYFNCKQHVKEVILKLADQLPQDSMKNTSNVQG